MMQIMEPLGLLSKIAPMVFVVILLVGAVMMVYGFRYFFREVGIRNAVMGFHADDDNIIEIDAYEAVSSHKR